MTVLTQLDISTLDYSASKVQSTNSLSSSMDYLRMDGKQYASKVRNKVLEDFDWLSQWIE